MICRSTDTIAAAAPPVVYAQRRFHYRQCRACGSRYLDPIPDAAVVLAMYPPAYQGAPLTAPQGRFDAHLALLRAALPGGGRVFDYGCGRGEFMATVMAAGYAADGSEYNPAYVAELQAAFVQSRVWTIDPMASDPVAEAPSGAYDVIAFSNVLEHLADPGATLRQLMRLLKPGGLVLADGPIEANGSLVNALVWGNYWRQSRRSGAVLTHPPYHFSFTTWASQRAFFERAGLSERHYSTSESGWPLPTTWAGAQGLGGKVKWGLAQLSKAWHALNPRAGSAFLYLGQRPGGG